MLKKYAHAPAHLFLDNTPYFITGAIYEKRSLLKDIAAKRLLWKQTEVYFQKYCWELQHWVILDNHYHLMGISRLGEDLTRIVQGIHGSTSTSIQRTTGAQKPIWWNYWDYCPRNESDYYMRLNYLLWNPVKHGYVEKLEDYPFSSFHHLIEREEKNKIEEQFEKYPDYLTCVLKEAEDDDF
jgi:putative transposase